MTAEQNYLLDAVDRLTLNHVTKVMQTKTVEDRDAEGHVTASIDIACISEVDHDPLLVQLRDAVAGGIGSHAGSSPARERMPIDPSALALFDEIVAQVNAWYSNLPGAVEERYLHDRLRDWYIDYENRRRAGKVAEDAEVDTLKLVEGWARRIEGMFDPPITLELTQETRVPVMVPKTRRRVDPETGESWREPVVDADGNPVMLPKLKGGVPVTRVTKVQPAPCPICGERYALNPKTGDQMTAIIIEYRNIGAETLDKATGLCRFCDTVWRGRNGLRELRWLVDHPEDETA